MSSGFVQTNAITQQPVFVLPVPDANQTVTLSIVDCGKIIVIPANPLVTQVQNISLPAASPGLSYRLVAGATIARDVNILCPGNVTGRLYNNAAGAATAIIKTAAASFQFDATAVLGDYADVYCIGTTWIVQGMSNVVGGFA